MAELIESGDIRDTALSTALGERYLSYALSTIMARSLPDVRDGLKPVHRRLLYAMRALKLDPNAGYKKCARIVGDVMGKYHPHGDQAIYDALVRLAQSFAQRYPLVDGQGNFGNIDGDNAAAMRYTEARLTEVAEALLVDIDEDTVDFRETYDGEDKEPLVLPAGFPGLLANGAAGIAVGMATNIPPHNILELCRALRRLIAKPNTDIAALVNIVQGPDFPTGGMLVEPADAILEAYSTGRGGFRLRAKWEIEHGKRGTYQIIVSEIPYQVPKSRIIEKLAELIQQRKVPMLADIRDESADDIRLVIEPRSGRIDAHQLMEHLFRLTDLEVRVSLNMNVLDADQTPRVMNLKQVLQAYLDHRHHVLVRRSQHRLQKIEQRLNVLDGYLIAYLNLDEIIRIIREEDDPKAEMSQRFGLNDAQAEAILNMRLRALRRLEEIAIKKEHKKLSAARRDLKALLKDEGKRWAAIADEIEALQKKLGADKALSVRRTQFGDLPATDLVPLEAMIEREPITIICSQKGWLRSIKGHVADGSDVRYKEGDRGRFWLHAETTDKLIIFATNGRFYTLSCDKLPGGRGNGEPIRLMLDLSNEVDVTQMFVHKPGRKLLVAASDGRGFIVSEDVVLAQTRGGKQVLNLAANSEACRCVAVEGDHVAVIGENRKLAVFAVSEVPEMNRGRGVILQRYRDGGLSDIKVFDLDRGLRWKLAGGRERTERDLTDWLGKRGAAGRLPPKGFPRNNVFT